MKTLLQGGCGCVGLCVILLVGLIMLSQVDLPESSSAAPTVTLDKSPEKQAQRKEFIEKLIRRGVFTKVAVPGTTPRAFAGPAFYSLSIDDKNTFLSVVYAYYHDGSDPLDSVGVYDNFTGNKIGEYDPHGLKMY